MDTYNDLYEFIDAAVKNRNYAENTGPALKTALNLFRAELNAAELSSLAKFKENIDKIHQAVFTKNKAKFTAGSLATYKARVLRTLKDYEAYGKDPAKMASWSVKAVTRPKRAFSQHEEKNTLDDQTRAPQSSAPNITRLEVALRPDAKFVIEVPGNISAREIEKIKSILDSLSKNAEEDEETEVHSK